MSTPSPLNDREQADLVAFLDGELGGEPARQIEARISHDPAVRAEADSLKKAWDLLDFLPRAEPSPSFTERTLSRLAPVRKTGVATAPRRRGWLWRSAAAALWLAALAGAGWGGFVGYNRLVPPPSPAEPDTAAVPRPADGPARLDQFPPEVREFVEKELRPMLTAEEGKQLADAEGHWPQLAQTIALLSERHPVLPPLPSGRIVRWNDLPQSVKSQVFYRRLEARAGGVDGLARIAGRWPDYALLVSDTIRRDHKGPPPPPTPFGACRPDDLPPAARDFVVNDLHAALDNRDRDALKRVEGRWPDYPRKLHELARENSLVIPGMSLPGPRQLWESARAELPDLPDHALLDFAMRELGPEERAELNFVPADPASRERLRHEYFRRHPGELHRPRKMGGPQPPMPPE
jgi:hypothetical protein